MSAETIFVSIASYQDDMLRLTIADAAAKARFPERLRFGVVEQREMQRRINPSQHARRYMRYVGVEPEDSRGVGWARALCMSLYQNEDWYFQIDAHMLFDQGWDEKFIADSKALENIVEKPIISGYPKRFWFEQGAPVRQQDAGTNVHILQEKPGFKNSTLLLVAAGKLFPLKHAVKAWHIAAGCLFARGGFVSEMPYDAQIYFEGEEQTLALRAITNGWDIFHTPDMPVYHYWDRDRRTAHWECDADKKRHENWAALQTKSLARVRRVLSGEALGVYGVGGRRSIQDYADFCGVDYIKQTLEPRYYEYTLPKDQ
jgi:hypothetical protein